MMDNLEMKPMSRREQIADLKQKIAEHQEKFKNTPVDQLESDHDLILENLKKRLSDLEHTPEYSDAPHAVGE